jgi:hypothetical protein
MTTHTYPRPESAAHKAMCRLVDLGGKATMSQLMSVLGAEFRSTARFDLQVTNLLLKYALATVHGDTLTATAKGKEFVGAFNSRYLPKSAPYVGKIAAPRTAPIKRDLNTAKHFPQLVVREGAFDHRTIPSLMGGKRVLPGGEVVE